MLGVHIDHGADEYANRGWVAIKVKNDRVWFVDPEKTCVEPVRGSGGKKCLLDKGHRGYHCARVFYCDGCGRTGRGDPYRSDAEQGIAFCFLCILDDRKRYGYPY